MGYIDYAAARPRPAEDCVVYLDHAATTPMLPEALAAMTEELGQLGNPSSLHNAGRRARRWSRSRGSRSPRCSAPGPAR